MRSSGGRQAAKTELDINALVGTWTNTYRATNWINRFTIVEDNGVARIHAYSVGEPHDWGETEITPYSDSSGELAFHAVYDLESVQSVLAANKTKGIIVIAAYHKFKDGAMRQNLFCREFYFRE